MNTVRQESNTKTVHSVLCGALLVLVAAFPQTAMTADSPVLSDTPIANTTSVQVKPNIMLLMDTSNSMRFSHMPDEMEGTNTCFPDRLQELSVQHPVLQAQPGLRLAEGFNRCRVAVANVWCCIL